MPRKENTDSAKVRKFQRRSTATKLPLEELERRNSLIEEYAGFAELIVARLIRSMRLPMSGKDDFISAGFLGLVEAAGRFDASRGPEFRAYAYLRIRGAIIDYMRTSCDLTGYAYRRLKALEAAQELREAELEGRSAAGASRDSRSGHAVSYLEKIAVAFKVSGERDEDNEENEELDLQHPEALLEEKQRLQKIRSIVATLPEKERTIIEQYYFRDQKFVDVAEQFAGVSKSWVSRLHDRALGMLRDKMADSIAEIAA
jgi:RNA polymerase sigma factor for flagellar operon FliA